jgi:predicted enzyme related to lactoylglutathione lyase
MPEFTRHEPGLPCWLDISVATAELRESLIDFYVTVFGWTFDVGGPETSFYSVALLAGKPVLAVGQQDGGTGAYIVYFGTDDIAVAAERATELAAMCS